MGAPLRVVVSNLVAGELVLDAAASHYLLRVHRARVGDALSLIDLRAGLEADATLIAGDSRGARVSVMAPRPAPHRGVLPVVLLQVVGKGDKPEAVVREATALGARGIVFVESERSVPRLGERAATRLERWMEVAISAARQSGRGDLPEIAPPRALPDVLGSDELGDGRRLVLAPGDARPLLDVLSDWSLEEAPLCLLIGPEGGLTRDELELAEQRGFVRVSLGPLVLRTETAATAALGAIAALAETRRRA